MTLSDLSPTPVSLPSGIELNYVRSGTGPCLIFIHGAMGDWRSAGTNWDFFTERFDCITYSRRYSYPNGNELNVTNHSALVDAEDLEALMDQLGIQKAILVGSSYGGFTALAFAARAPERVAALVAVEAPMMRYAHMTEEGSKIAKAFLSEADDPAREAFKRGDDEMGVRILTGGIAGKDPNAIPPHVMERRMLNAKAARSLSLSEDEFPLIAPEVLGSFDMPIMLMTGINTAPVHTEIFKKVGSYMPNARKRIIENAGHSIAIQVPDVFNQEVFQFLSDNNLTNDELAAQPG